MIFFFLFVLFFIIMIWDQTQEERCWREACKTSTRVLGGLINLARIREMGAAPSEMGCSSKCDFTQS